MILLRATRLLVTFFIFGIGSELSIQADETLSKSQGPVDNTSYYKWDYEGFLIKGKNTQVSVSLSGTARRHCHKKKTVYSFTLGPLEKEKLKTASPHSGELKYATEISFVYENDGGRIRVDQPGNSQKAKAAADITKRFVQYFVLRKELGNLASFQGVGLSAVGWSNDYSEAGLRTEHYAADDPVVYTWGEKRGWEKISVWWIVKQYERKAKFLRLERMSGELENAPSYSDFREFVHKIRFAFLEDTLEDKEILAYDGAFEMTICTITEVDKSNSASTPENSANSQ